MQARSTATLSHIAWLRERGVCACASHLSRKGSRMTPASDAKGGCIYHQTNAMMGVE